MWKISLEVGTKSCIYKYAVLLARPNYCDLSSGETLLKTKRKFYVMEWQTVSIPQSRLYGVRTGTTKNEPPIKHSGWLPLYEYTGKWEKSGYNYELDYFRADKPMMPAHIFFKTKEEFLDWLGISVQSKLFADLL